ncbi:MAG: HAD-IB family hydrolase [Acidimicrobiia bacterium]|jgi:HAD superfamily hydrolase (TIGR01490 family)
MKSAAFFDLDRTLISGASIFPFAIESWRQGLASGREVAGWALDAAAFKLLGETEDRNEEARSAMLGKVAGVSVEKLADIGEAVLPKLVARLRPESRKLVEMHRQAGRDTWIASASPQEIVEPLARALDMTGAIGTRGKIVDGHYTDELDGPFCHGPGKAEAVGLVAIRQGYDLATSYAYSDAIGDLPLLDLVGHPVAVNPDSQLTQVARERGWPVVVFARKTKQAVAWSALGVSAASFTAVAYVLGRRHGRTATLVGLADGRISLPGLQLRQS